MPNKKQTKTTKKKRKLVAILNRVEVWIEKDQWVLRADKRDVSIENNDAKEK